MSKKIVALFLALLLCVGMLPAFAEEEAPYGDGRL